MTSRAKSIFYKVASIQLEAIDRILNKEDIDLDLALDYLQVSEEQIVSKAKQLKQCYISLQIEPSIDSLTKLGRYQLLICSHIMYSMEKYGIISNPSGLFEAWDTLHRAIRFLYPEFNILRL